MFGKKVFMYPENPIATVAAEDIFTNITRYPMNEAINSFPKEFLTKKYSAALFGNIEESFA